VRDNVFHREMGRLACVWQTCRVMADILTAKLYHLNDEERED